MTSDDLGLLLALKWHDPHLKRWFFWWRVRMALRIPPWEWANWFRVTKSYFRMMDRLVRSAEKR